MILFLVIFFGGDKDAGCWGDVVQGALFGFFGAWGRCRRRLEGGSRFSRSKWAVEYPNVRGELSK